MRCATCGHMPWVHGSSGPTGPCEVCIRCESDRCHCLQGRKPCPCRDYRAKEAS
jgi:hypothetical protein